MTDTGQQGLDYQNDNDIENPFEKHTDERLLQITLEIRGIVARLEAQAFQHADVLVSSKNIQNLFIAYEIKDVLLACKRCQRLLTKAVEKKEKAVENSENAPQKQKDIRLACSSLSEDIQFAIGKTDAAMDQYVKRYPNNKPVAFIRLASGVTVVSASYLILQCFIPKEPELEKKFITGVAGVVIAINSADQASSLYKRVRDKLFPRKRKGREGYHILAAKRIDALLNERPQPQETRGEVSAGDTGRFRVEDIKIG